MHEHLKIILVEDLPSDAYLVERELRKGLGDIGIIVSENREDFREQFNSFNPDIVLSDFSLPEFDWQSALRISRELAPAIPFLVVSGSSNQLIVDNCLAAGADGFINKDELHRLVPVMKKLLGI